MTILEGNYSAENQKIAIVATRWNDFIVSRLIEGAKDCFARHGGNQSVNLTLAMAPGAYELPLIVKKIATSGKYDAVVALGCVIRGGTPHFDYVAGTAARGIADTSSETGVPCIFGVLTTDSIEQAIERAGTKAGNKGWEAMLSAIETINLLKQI